MIKNLLYFSLVIIHYPLVAGGIKPQSVLERLELERSWFSFSDYIVIGTSRIRAQVLPCWNVTSQTFPSMVTTPCESGLNLQMNIQTG